MHEIFLFYIWPGSMTSQHSLSQDYCCIKVTGSFKPSGLFPPALQK
ncbi:hypothetical protein ECP03048161_5190 [Escherichia coli P0304816.1]|nr:hypothetical protein ECP03048161_5190 [Escherichia coli P0304816.1]ENF29020.1 hypothetical protein ECP030481612_3397 [Escherichia coli P0304816.12]